MAHHYIPIDSLPNELLIQSLSSFSTLSLLPLAAVCRRWRAVVGRLHYARLVEATRLEKSRQELLLECYHPSNKISTPSLYCEYLGTDGLSEASKEADISTLKSLYTRFRPYLGEENRRPRARWPTAGVIQEIEEPLDEIPSHDVHLGSGEQFSQLCTLVNLVKNGPRRGLFLSIAPVGDGVIRIWRDWLDRAAREQQRESLSSDESSILWTDLSKDVGLKFRVIEDQRFRAPILVGPNDDPPVSYKLEYQELIVRTNVLYMGLEVSEAHQVQHTGKAIVIAAI
ncbi:hypothetical protein F4778DRAFT_776759 [Xylariomycetidae sp. FL2044]|nr:hypothetical protein F4778DRAFT_776759 [Xylariomycetidae sp. FL2044]